MLNHEQPRNTLLVPRRGLEPPRLAALVPETSASTNSAIWARGVGCLGAAPHTVNAKREIRSPSSTRWRAFRLSTIRANHFRSAQNDGDPLGQTGHDLRRFRFPR